MLGHEAAARRLIVAGAGELPGHCVPEVCPVQGYPGGHERLVTELLIGGADPNCRDGDDGASLLHVAAYK